MENKNIFIVTLGTRDIQFLLKDIDGNGFIKEANNIVSKMNPDVQIAIATNTNYPDYIFPSKPRIAGEIIVKNYNLFESLIQFPLISEAFKNIYNTSDNEKPQIHEIIVVYTNQSDLNESNKKFSDNDTIYYKDILEKHLRSKFSNLQHCIFKNIAVEEKVKDIDHQYIEFGKKCKSLYEDKDNIKQIFLLAQGGIDQINNSLTLQLIQAFGHKVKLWQQAEADKPTELRFPFMFIQDLNKQKILKHLEDYDFGLISDLLNNTNKEQNNSLTIENADIILNLSTYASKKLNLDYHFDTSSINQKYIEKNDTETKCRDLFLAAKIYYHRKDYGNYLWRIFTLMENIYRFKCEKILGDTEDLYNSKYNNSYDENLKWIEVLKKVNGLYEYLQTKTVNSNKNNPKYLKLNNPNRKTFKHIYNYLIANKYLTDSDSVKNKLNQVFNITDSKLNALRNDIAHYLRPINIDIIDDALNNSNKKQIKNISCEYINSLLDDIFVLRNNCFGIYDDIKDEIKRLL
jgi:hypothetical protein